MKLQRIRDMLAETLDDRRLSRNERSAWSRIFDHTEPDERQLARYRSIAVDLAREAIDGANGPFAQTEAASAGGSAGHSPR